MRAGIFRKFSVVLLLTAVLLPLGALDFSAGISQTCTATSAILDFGLGPVDLVVEGGFPLIRTVYSPQSGSCPSGGRLEASRLLNYPLFNIRVMYAIGDFPNFIGKTGAKVQIGITTDMVLSLGENHDGLVGSYGLCLGAEFRRENLSLGYMIAAQASNILLFIPKMRATGGPTKYGYYILGNIDRGSDLFEDMTDLAWWNSARVFLKYRFR